MQWNENVLETKKLVISAVVYIYKYNVFHETQRLSRKMFLCYKHFSCMQPIKLDSSLIICSSQNNDVRTITLTMYIALNEIKT